MDKTVANPHHKFSLEYTALWWYCFIDKCLVASAFHHLCTLRGQLPIFIGLLFRFYNLKINITCECFQRKVLFGKFYQHLCKNALNLTHKFDQVTWNLLYSYLHIVKDSPAMEKSNLG